MIMANLVPVITQGVEVFSGTGDVLSFVVSLQSIFRVIGERGMKSRTMIRLCFISQERLII